MRIVTFICIFNIVIMKLLLFFFVINFASFENDYLIGNINDYIKSFYRVFYDQVHSMIEALVELLVFTQSQAKQNTIDTAAMLVPQTKEIIKVLLLRWPP